MMLSKIAGDTITEKVSRLESVVCRCHVHVISSHGYLGGELVKRCRLFYGGSFRPHPRVTRIIGHVR
jgi:hypothetical protein